MSLLNYFQSQFTACRQHTEELVQKAVGELFYRQVHPEFSPIGWHYGHIIYTQELWLLRRTAGYPPLLEKHQDQLLAQDGLPKPLRQGLPPYEWLQEYGDKVNYLCWQYLGRLSIDGRKQQERLWHWLLQHEAQHCETMSFLLAMAGVDVGTPPIQERSVTGTIPAGSLVLGSNSILSLDNEQPAQSIYLPEFKLDPQPVTVNEYMQFIEADGYHDPQYWSKASWQWLKENQITKPLYWQTEAGSLPVYGVSWYEACAYAQFVGKRLPTEAEWEKACQYYPELLGKVWQWTSSKFAPYAGFRPFPYQGYSANYFDDRHYVLRGGSWVTLPWAKRSSFRNWYLPTTRELFAGILLVYS